MIHNLQEKSKKKTKSMVFKIGLVFMFLSCSVTIINITTKPSENQTMGNLNQNFKSPDDWTFLVYLAADNDDNYEENNNYTTAYDLSSYETIWLSSINGSGVQADDDWYEIYIDPGYEFLQVRLTFIDAEGNIDLRVYESDGTSLVTTSTSFSDNESIFHEVSTFGTYYLLVDGGGAGNDYDLWWNDTIVPSDDNYEENDYNYNAYNLSSYEATWLSSINGSGVQLDDDWYEIYIDPGDERLQVNLTFSHAKGNIDLRVIASDYTTIISSSTSFSNNEYINTIVPSSGTYYLFIYNEDAGNKYDLWWNDIKADDNYEENDNYTTAYDLSSNETTWLSAIDGLGIQLDDDWYEIYIDPGYERLQVNLTFSDDEGDIDIDVYASDGYSLITSSTSFSDNESIDYIVPTSGTYYLYIYYGDAGNEYDLWWDDLTYTNPADDNYEENDYYYEAYNLSSYEAIWLSSISGMGVQLDDDWYEIYIDPGNEHLEVTLTFNHVEGDIDLILFASDGTSILIESDSITDNENIDIVVSTSGIYYLLVYWEDAGNEYDLLWSCSEYIPQSERRFSIPGYDLFILFGALIAISSVIIRKSINKKLEFY